MENNLEYLQVTCGAYKYLFIRKGNKYSVMYLEPMKKMQQFARVDTLSLAYKIAQSHLKGRHKSNFTLRDLLDNSSSVKIGNFMGVKIV